MSKRKAKTRTKAQPSVRGRRPTKRQREMLRRQRISDAMKLYWKTKKTKAQRIRASQEKMPKLPKGFERVDPRGAISFMLHQAGTEMSARYGYDYDVRHAVNADKSISYEMRMVLPRRGFDPQKFMTDLANALHHVPGTWISMGFRFQPKRLSEDERETYDRYRGNVQIQAYTRRSSGRRIVALEATAEQILANVEAKKGWRPEQVFVRVHWSPEGVAGKRPHRTNLKG